MRDKRFRKERSALNHALRGQEAEDMVKVRLNDYGRIERVKETGPQQDSPDEIIERQGQMIVKQAEELQAIANKIHYPDCWDTMAYPTLLDAVHECYEGCSQCGGGFVDGMKS